MVEVRGVTIQATQAPISPKPLQRMAINERPVRPGPSRRRPSWSLPPRGFRARLAKDGLADQDDPRNHGIEIVCSAGCSSSETGQRTHGTAVSTIRLARIGLALASDGIFRLRLLAGRHLLFAVMPLHHGSVPYTWTRTDLPSRSV